MATREERRALAGIMFSRAARAGEERERDALVGMAADLQDDNEARRIGRKRLAGGVGAKQAGGKVPGGGSGPA